MMVCVSLRSEGESGTMWPFRCSACVGWLEAWCFPCKHLSGQRSSELGWLHQAWALISWSSEWSRRRRCSGLTSNTDVERRLSGNGINLWPDDLIAFTWCHRCKTLSWRLNQLQQEDSLLLTILLSATSQLRQVQEEPQSWISGSR